MPPSPVEIMDEPAAEPVSLDAFFKDLTENCEEADESDSDSEYEHETDTDSTFNDFEIASDSGNIDDSGMVDTQPNDFTENIDDFAAPSDSGEEMETNFEFDASEMVALPEIFFNDVLTESKTNRMLEGFLDFEETKKELSKMMPEIPSLTEISKTGLAKIEKFTPRRDLDKDFEDLFKDDGDDFLGMPKKLSMDGLKIELDAILNSPASILAPKEEQILYKKSYDQVMKALPPPQFSAPKSKKSSPQFVVQDEFAPDLPTTEASAVLENVQNDIISEALTDQTDDSVNLTVSLDHDYFKKRPVSDQDIISEASLPKKSKNSEPG